MMFRVALIVLVPLSQAVAFEKNIVLGTLPDNTGINLGSYTCQPSEWGSTCRGITDYSGFVYDSDRHQMLMFGGGHATTMRDDVDVFSFSSLTWSSAYPSTECSDMAVSDQNKTNASWIPTGHPISRHTYDMLTYIPWTGELVVLCPPLSKGYCAGGTDADFWYSGKIAHYNPDTKLWRYSASGPNLWGSLKGTAVDPVSQLAIIMGNTGVFTYDPVTEVTQQVLEEFPDAMKNKLSYSKNLVYFPPLDRFYYMLNSGGVFELIPNRTNWSASVVQEITGVSGTAPSANETGWEYDSVNQIIGGGIHDGYFHAYDPVSNSWTRKTIGVGPEGATGPVGTLAFHAIDYDPVNNVFLFISNRDSGYRTWAYRYKNERTVAITIEGGTPCIEVAGEPGNEVNLFHSFDLQSWSTNTSLVLTSSFQKVPIVGTNTVALFQSLEEVVE